MSTQFASTVLAARNRHGWTLEEIAGQLDVSLSAVQSWLKPAATSRREAPDWATPALKALVTGRAVSVRRGALTITYAPATTGGRP